MKITCTGRKVSLKENFLEKVDKKLTKLNKFFSDEAEAQVTVTVEKDWQTVEVTIKDKGFVSRSEKSADRMEDALDIAVDVLSRRIVKNRKRLENKLYQTIPEDMPKDETADDEPYNVIREKHFYVKPSSVDEAILEMNMLGHEFFLFRDAASDEINVVYRRKNGSYGLLVPER
ncbi:MAG: ribosome-associated translation inhibitor RaiA [Oscillospiraceae bacterium]